MKGRLAIGAALLLVLWALLFFRFGRDRMPGSTASTGAAAPEPALAQSPAVAARPQPSRAPAAEPQVAPARPEAAPPRAPPPPIGFGKVDAFKRAFDRHPRDAQAGAAEARINALFGTEQVPRDLLVAATCRKTVCRIRVLWSQQQAEAYPRFLMAAGVKISETAVDPQGVPDQAGKLAIDVYVLREGMHSVEQAGEG